MGDKSTSSRCFYFKSFKNVQSLFSTNNGVTKALLLAGPFPFFLSWFWILSSFLDFARAVLFIFSSFLAFVRAVLACLFSTSSLNLSCASFSAFCLCRVKSCEVRHLPCGLRSLGFLGFFPKALGKQGIFKMPDKSPSFFKGC
jgi:hypothetical protein